MCKVCGNSYKETITNAIENSICSSFDLLKHSLFDIERPYRTSKDIYKDMNLYLWVKFLNERYDKFFGDNSYHIVATWVLKHNNYKWHEKLDMVEVAYQWRWDQVGSQSRYIPIIKASAQRVNNEFERLKNCYQKDLLVSIVI